MFALGLVWYGEKRSAARKVERGFPFLIDLTLAFATEGNICSELYMRDFFRTKNMVVLVLCYHIVLICRSGVRGRRRWVANEVRSRTGWGEDNAYTEEPNLQSNSIWQAIGAKTLGWDSKKSESAARVQEPAQRAVSRPSNDERWDDEVCVWCDVARKTTQNQKPKNMQIKFSSTGVWSPPERAATGRRNPAAGSLKRE